VKLKGEQQVHWLEGSQGSSLRTSLSTGGLKFEQELKDLKGQEFWWGSDENSYIYSGTCQDPEVGRKGRMVKCREVGTQEHGLRQV
jgi:hypothetical protein